MSVNIQTTGGLLKVAGSSAGSNPMVGATESTNGTSGIVPAPSAGDNNKFLKGDGTWGTIDGVEASVASTSEPNNQAIGDYWVQEY